MLWLLRSFIVYIQILLFLIGLATIIPRSLLANKYVLIAEEECARSSLDMVMRMLQVSHEVFALSGWGIMDVLARVLLYIFGQCTSTNSHWLHLLTHSFYIAFNKLLKRAILHSFKTVHVRGLTLPLGT